MKKRVENFFIEKNNNLVNYKIIHVYTAADIYEAEHEYSNNELLFADMEKHNTNKRIRTLRKANKMNYPYKKTKVTQKMTFEEDVPF